MALISADFQNILNLYLYGTLEKPVLLQDRLRDIKQDYEFTGGLIDTTSYMNIVGEGAFPSRAPLVADFFNGDIPRSLGVTDADGVTRLTLSEYIAHHPGNADHLNFTVSQYMNNPSSPTFTQRAFIWGTTQFTINQSAVLTWGSDGSKRIDGLEVRPRKLEGADENFDFNAGSPVAQLINEQVLHPAIDPYSIGRILNFEFDEKPGTVYASYSLNDFDANQSEVSQYQGPLDAASYLAAAVNLAASIRNEEVVDYFDKQGRFIIYGGQEDDSLTVESAAGPLSATASSSVGLAIVGGGGGDTVTGSLGFDLLYGGNGNDTLNGGFGVDIAGYAGTSGSYLVTTLANGSFQISHDRGAQTEGMDNLTKVERLEFVNGTFDLLHFSAKPSATSIDEGGTLTIKVSAVRADESGPSTDAWVYVKPEASGSGALLTDADFVATNASLPPALSSTAAAEAARQSSGGFWVKIPAGQTEASLRLLAKQDGSNEGVEAAKFNITSYVQLVKNTQSGSTYLDAPIHYDFGAINTSASQVLVNDKDTDISLYQYGGYEGFYHTVSVPPNTTVDLSFDAKAIPDYLKIWDPITGRVYVDTAFISSTYADSFTVDSEGSGRLQVAVMTNDRDTSWNLDVTSDPASAAAAARGRPALQLQFLETAAPTFVSSVELSFGNTVVTANTLWTSVQEENPLEGNGTQVYVARRGNLSEALFVGWRLETYGDEPVSAADFGSQMPEGIVTFDTGQANAQFSFAAVQDGLDEVPEGYHIVFFDPTTGTALAGINGGASALTGEIVPPPSGLVNGTNGNDVIVAGPSGSVLFAKAGNDILTGGDGNDWIDAGIGDDVLEGGAGADNLMGGEGSDQYQFDQSIIGLAQDVVEDYGSAADFDVLDLGDFGDIVPVYAVEGDDVLITNPLTLQTIRLVGQLDGEGVEQVIYHSRGISNVLDRDSLADTAGGHTYHLGDGDLFLDVMYENYGASLILGVDLAGLEQVFYRSYYQTELNIDVGDGSTIQIANLFTDLSEGVFTGVTLANGTFLTVSDLQEFAVLRGTEYNDYITLGEGNDRIEGGGGDDFVNGDQGSDIYEYSLGDGNDTITDTRASDGDLGGDHNTLRLHGIAPGEVTGERIGNGVVLAFGAGSSIVLDHQLGIELPHRGEIGLPSGGVTTIEFDNGTIWNADAIRAVAGYVAPLPSPLGTAGIDVLIGDYWNDDILGLSGDDQIDGGSGGDDLLDGGDGDDQIAGGTGLDLLDGGIGNDTLNGGSDADRLFGGAGQDILNGGSGADELAGQDGIDLVHGDDGNDTVFAGDSDAANDTFDGGLSNDTLDYSEADLAITFDLAAGTATSAAEGVDSYVSFERLVGSQNDDNFVLDGSSIELVGGKGADYYVVSATAMGGAILINDSYSDGNELILEAFNPSDVVFRFVRAEESWGSNPAMPAYLQIEIPSTGGVIKVPSEILKLDEDNNKLFGLGRVTFADGTTWDAADISQAAWIRGTWASDSLDGTDFADTFYGGSGDDYIYVGPGTDRVAYRSGDGNDVVNTITEGGETTLDLLDLTLSDIGLERADNDLLVTVGSTGEQIRVVDQFYGSGITTIHFSDGQTVDRAHIEASAFIPPIIGTAGADYLSGGLNPETLDGGLGNDLLNGGRGNDTYIYRTGDGSDSISDYSGDNGDVLKLLDLNVTDLSFSAADQDLHISVNTTGQIINLFDYSNGNNSIDIIQFADGFTLDRAGIDQLISQIGGSSESFAQTNVPAENAGGAGGAFLSYGLNSVVESTHIITGANHTEVQSGADRFVRAPHAFQPATYNVTDLLWSREDVVGSTWTAIGHFRFALQPDMAV